MLEKQAKTHELCEIKWNVLSPHDWEQYFYTIKRSNLLQSYSYGNVMSKLNNQRVRRGLITINGKNAGLVQILEAGILNNALHAVILDRGPLWFDEYGSKNDFQLFMQEFTNEFPKRLGRRIRLIPEIENKHSTRDIMCKYGYKASVNIGYKTIYIDLRHDIEVLRKKLKKKWRNSLAKAEKTELKVVFSDKADHFSWLLQHYAADKAVRKYDGPAPKVIAALAEQLSSGKNMLIGTALLDSKPIASILLFNHGASSTYQIGYTTELGRKHNAHNLLLWNAVIELKERNIYDFDLGGINDGSAKNVRIFKEGLGGKLYENLGLYN